MIVKQIETNIKTGKVEYKDIDITLPIITIEKSENEKLITYAKAQGWI